MIITTTRHSKIGNIEITETASVKVQDEELIDTVLRVLFRIREQWSKGNPKLTDVTKPMSKRPGEEWTNGDDNGS